MPKPRNETRYTIKNNKININNQKKNALDAKVECCLNGFKWIAKNITNINKLLLKFKIKSKFGIPIKTRNKSIDNKAPIIRNEKDLKDFRDFSLNTLSTKVITNMMNTEANSKLRSANRSKLVKYKGHDMKLRYEILIRDVLILSLLESITFQKANNLKR